MTAPVIPDTTLLEIDLPLLQRHDDVTRYGIYPTADRFSEDFDEDRYRHALATHALGGLRPLSLYVHLPFCASACYYCASHKVITADHDQADTYLDYLEREIALQGAAYGATPKVTQLHLGGGTPTFLQDTQLSRLLAALQRYFPLAAGAECSVEIDPRHLGPQSLQLLASHGFSHLSISLQDFSPDVQLAVNRMQPASLTADTIAQSRALGYRAIHIDLLYGLPRQTPASMARTLAQVLTWLPDRVSLNRYSHQPERFKTQRHIDAATLPAADDKLAMLQQAITQLQGAGYVHLGLEQFALPQDELAVAMRQGRLHRNFQGYTTQAESDLIGLGVSAIGKVGACYAQNHRVLEDYYDALAHHHLPIARGMTLAADDLLRRSIIQSLLCQSEVTFEPLETRWLIDFRHYFAYELEQLQQLASQGLLKLHRHGLEITPKGHWLTRSIAMVFDRHLREARNSARFSSLI